MSRTKRNFANWTDWTPDFAQTLGRDNHSAFDPESMNEVSGQNGKKKLKKEMRRRDRIASKRAFIDQY